MSNEAVFEEKLIVNGTIESVLNFIRLYRIDHYGDLPNIVEKVPGYAWRDDLPSDGHITIIIEPQPFDRKLITLLAYKHEPGMKIGRQSDHSLGGAIGNIQRLVIPHPQSVNYAQLLVVAIEAKFGNTKHTASTTYPRHIEFHIDGTKYLGDFHTQIEKALTEAESDYNRAKLLALINQPLPRSPGIPSVPGHDSSPLVINLAANVLYVKPSQRVGDDQLYNMTIAQRLVAEIWTTKSSTGGAITVRWIQEGEPFVIFFCQTLSPVSDLSLQDLMNQPEHSAVDVNPPLTERQEEFVRLLVAGRTRAQIETEMTIDSKTAKVYQFQLKQLWDIEGRGTIEKIRDEARRRYPHYVKD